MELGNLKIPCGCDNRKEIMGAGEYKTDLLLVAGLIVLAVVIFGVKELR